jgi:hypothetical protein
MTIKLIGNDDGSCTYNYIGPRLIMGRYTASASATLTEIQLEVLTNINVTVALYADNSGSPGNVLTIGTNTAATTGSIRSFAVTPYPIVSGTVYWLAVATSGTGMAAKTSTATSRWKTITYPYVHVNTPSGTTTSTYFFQLAGWGNLPGRRSQVIIL